MFIYYVFTPACITPSKKDHTRPNLDTVNPMLQKASKTTEYQLGKCVISEFGVKT